MPPICPVPAQSMSEIFLDAIHDHCQYLMTTARDYIDYESGLKKEDRAVAFVEYCAALDHVLLSFGILKVDEDASIAEKRIAKFFK